MVDPRTDPVATYEHLLGHGPPAIDLLLPHANWASPPSPAGPSPTPYGDWLSVVYDRWCQPRERETSVRLFDEIGRSIVGLPSRVETVGLSPACVVVVETNGEIEQVDALRSTYTGASRTGLNVRDHAFDLALWHPTTVARQLGDQALGDTCRRCDLRRVCGGGYYPHRYHETSGFRNPSVYCRDLEVLIRHVIGRLGGAAGA